MQCSGRGARAAAAAAAAPLVLGLVAAPLAARDTTEPVNVTIEEHIYPLLTDFDANGVPDLLLIRSEIREGSRLDGDDTAPRRQARTLLNLVEPEPSTSRRGVLVDGRRYHYLSRGTFELDGFEARFEARDVHTYAPAMPGSSLNRGVQARFGMLGLVAIGLRPAGGGPLVAATIFNVERGVFRLTIDEEAFADVLDSRARRHFAVVIAGANRREDGPSVNTVADRRPGPTELDAPTERHSRD